jgi:hypothetical protein
MIEPGFKAILEDFNHSATIAWYRGDRGRRSADRLLQDWDARWDLDLHAKRRGSKVQFSAKRRGDLPIEPVDLPANEHVWDVATRQLLELPAVDAS